MAAMGIKNYIAATGKYTGESGEDAEKYFRQVERYRARVNYNDNDKAQMIPFGLKEKALDYYETLHQDVKADYGQTKEALIGHYKPNKSDILKFNELYKIKKKRGESVSDFYDAIRKQALKIDGLSDFVLLACFMNGLSGSLKLRVAAYEPADIKTALEKSKLIESIEEEDDKVSASTHYGSEGKVNSQEQQERKALQKEVEGLKKRLASQKAAEPKAPAISKEDIKKLIKEALAENATKKEEGWGSNNNSAAFSPDQSEKRQGRGNG